MRIVHINFDYGLAGVGGASIAASRLHNELLNSGIDSWFVCNFQRESGRNIIQVPANRTCTRWLFRYTGKILRNVWRFTPIHKPITLNIIPSGMAQVVEQLNPQVIHIQWIVPDVLSWAELKRMRFPMVVSLHDFWMLSGFTPYVGDARTVTGYSVSNSGWLERFLFRQKRTFLEKQRPCLVGPSEWICRCAKESFLGRGLSCEAISNVLDTTTFQFNPTLRRVHNRIVILFGGQGGTRNLQKGFDDLLEALGRLPQEFKRGVECHVFGELADECFCNGVRIRYRGVVRSVADMVQIYHSADLLAVPSKHETQGQTKLEALACGLPVVAFDRTACAEGIVHKQNGWVAPDGDIESFKNGIVWCIEQLQAHADVNSWRQKISEAAVNEFGAKRVVPQYIDLYRRMCETEK